MNEKEWVLSVIDTVKIELSRHDKSLTITAGERLPYASEILSYSSEGQKASHTIQYETDILIKENTLDGRWKPRVIIEAKINSVTTHDAITYSQKAASHKQVHPYLRYGILIGNRKHYPLPGRLFRHGAHFDFMISWRGFEATSIEKGCLVELILEEVEASRKLEEIIFTSRDPNRTRYTYLHKPLRLK